MVTNSPLEKNKSNGFHPSASAGAAGVGTAAASAPLVWLLDLGDTDPLPLPRLGFAPPGLRRVKRWTRGAVMLMERMVEPPSVARALEMVEEDVEGAVW